jgi:hypothetical protein
MTSKSGENWVDQGHPPLQTIRRVLAHEFDRHAPADEEWLRAQANTILAMVVANATEVEVTNYLRTLGAGAHTNAASQGAVRLVGIALWHIAKVALVRDAAEKRLQRSLD